MMKQIRVALLAVALLPLGTFAAPPERREEVERQLRVARLVELSSELELDSAQALKMDGILRQFDERRRPLYEQVRESAKLLQRAAKGDSSAQSQVDQAAQRAFEARAQLATLDRELYQALSQDLPPQKKAQLALFLARFDRKAMKFKHKFHERRQRDDKAPDSLDPGNPG
ncbi:hypothetical protein [Stigmatella aurantiaca]|uniref:Conserved uncharacterized protein n=1 Tax=Stigmatella aurantiaca (strain DW4/3-1) TaxID=378806 RepID=Q092P7_STIAD|nr:hypothetical protein [Stigmatella aurantiaca]ADO70744.1 conserved uncharacterized protein [Stigmatella aurantiaca DW4/3-1]EAU66692.1 hypothetical protein STIAU_4268 [Stigmatella aurantiaca DW4/3-1]